MKKYNWYTVRVVAGQEKKVCEEINKQISRSEEIATLVKEALSPLQSILTIKQGKKIREKKNIFSGYIFVNAIYDPSLNNILRSIPKVAGLLGGKERPVPISSKEMDKIFKITNEEKNDDSSIVENFTKGELVRVIQGPFKTFSGIIEDTDPDKKKVKLNISILGRPTPVELNENQVTKVQE